MKNFFLETKFFFFYGENSSIFDHFFLYVESIITPGYLYNFIPTGLRARVVGATGEGGIYKYKVRKLEQSFHDISISFRCFVPTYFVPLFHSTIPRSFSKERISRKMARLFSDAKSELCGGWNKE